MQAIVYQLLSKGNTNFRHISDYSPFYEVNDTWGENGDVAVKYSANHAELGYRVFNTHLRWERMPKGSSCKYIYVYRNAMDACISFYHHLSNQADEDGGYSGTFEEFVQDWTESKIPFGTWAGHLRSWTEGAEITGDGISGHVEAQNPSILFVSYEGFGKLY